MMQKSNFLKRSNKTDKFTRAAKIEDTVVDKEKNTIELSFSSDTPVREWGGYLILGHGAGEADFTRLNDSGPLLLEHDRNQQIGVIEKAYIKDGKGRAVVRFSDKSDLAKQVFAEIQDGIRTKVSVGFSLKSAKLQKSDDTGDYYYADKWEAFEISIVSVPADTTVGVHRNLRSFLGSDADADPKLTTTRTQTTEDNMPAPVETPKNPTTETTVTVTATGDKARSKDMVDILNIGSSCNQSDFASEYIRTIGDKLSVRDFQEQLLKRAFPTSEPYNQHQALQSRSQEIGLSEKEKKQFSFVKCIRALTTNSKMDIDNASYEYEVCAEARKRAGVDAQGMFIPDEILFSRAMNKGISGTGASGAVIGETLSSNDLIPLLRNYAAILPKVTILSGLKGNLTIPKEGIDPSTYWLGETEAVTESNPNMGKITLSPKKLAALVQITNDLITQSSLDVELMVVQKIIASIALAVDKAILYGTGSGNQPKGLFIQDGLSMIDFINDVPTYQEILDLKGAVSSENANLGTLEFAASSLMLSQLEGTPRFASTDTPIHDSEKMKMAGRGVLETNQINNSEIFYGEFKKVLVARWGGIDLMVDPYSKRRNDIIEVSAFDRVDIGFSHIEAFSYGKKIS